MNNKVRAFVTSHLDKIQGKILEVGSRHANGDVSDLFQAVRTDMQEGKNVDVVCKAEDLPEMFGANSFDTVVCLEALEHMKDWKDCVFGMWQVLKPGGWLIMSMASMLKGRHDYPNDYWRADKDLLMKVWPNLQDFEVMRRVSIGWTVKKDGPLPDLAPVQLLPI